MIEASGTVSERPKNLGILRIRNTVEFKKKETGSWEEKKDCWVGPRLNEQICKKDGDKGQGNRFHQESGWGTWKLIPPVAPALCKGLQWRQLPGGLQPGPQLELWVGAALLAAQQPGHAHLSMGCCCPQIQYLTVHRYYPTCWLGAVWTIAVEAAPRGSPAWVPAGAPGGRPSHCCTAAGSCSPLHGVLLSADPVPYSTFRGTWKFIPPVVLALCKGFLWRLLAGDLQPEPQLELWVGAHLPAAQQPGHAHLSTGCCCPQIQNLTVQVGEHENLSHLLCWRCVRDSCGGCSPGISSLSPSWSSGWAPLSLLPSSWAMPTSPRGVAVRRSSTFQYTDIIPPVDLALCERLLWRLLPGGLQPESQLELWVGTPLPAAQQPGHAHLSTGCCCPQIQYLTLQVGEHENLSHLLCWRCVSDCCGGCSPGVSSLSPSWISGWAPLSLLPSSRVMLTSPQGVAVGRSSTLQYTDIITPVDLALCKGFLWWLLPGCLQPEPQLELWVGAPLPAAQQPGHAHLSTGSCCPQIQYLTVHRY